jgi:hypothetical protein
MEGFKSMPSTSKRRQTTIDLHVTTLEAIINYENTLRQNHKENSFVHGRMREDMNRARSSSRGKKAWKHSIHLYTRQTGL